MLSHKTLSEGAQSMDDVLRFALVKEGVDEVKFRKLTESDKKGISSILLSKVVESVKNKSLQVDYSVVAKSGGDVTKFQSFADLDASISFLMKMHAHQPNAPKEIPELDQCLKILVKYRNQFSMGFDQENEMVTYLYNNLLFSLITASSLLVATSVEYVKDSLGMYQAIFKKNVEQNPGMEMSLDVIKKINKYEHKGLLNSYFDSTYKASNFSIKGFNVDSIKSFFAQHKTLGVTMAAIAGIALLIYAMREAVYLYYWGRTSIAAELEQLSIFVQLNANTLGSDKQNIKEKQEKIARRLSDLSQAIAVEKKVAGRKASDEIRREDGGRTLGTIASEGDLL